MHANIGVEKYFFAAGDRILNRIKEQRNTVILPERTGPIADVLYSAGGNSADEHWYNRDVIAYSFETGADRYVEHDAHRLPPRRARPGIRAANRNGFGEGDKITVGRRYGQRGGPLRSPRWPSRTRRARNRTCTLTEPLALAQPVGAVGGRRTLQTGVGFQPDYATEGKHEALEFAAGNYGLLESALEYARDDEPPEVMMPGPTRPAHRSTTTFEYVNEPSVIHYTTDGSTPTESVGGSGIPPARVSRVRCSTSPRRPCSDGSRKTSRATSRRGGRSVFVIAPPRAT